MERDLPEQLIVVSGRPVALPKGVTAAEWALERSRFQNARIRTLLGAIGMLEQVLDSNYAILHCSPTRVREIWRQLREVGTLIRDRFPQLLRQPSPIPKLDESRRDVMTALDLLDNSTLKELVALPEEIDDERLPEMRKLLCVAMGRLHAFLQDSFGAVMGGDPRSLHDQDYFLSRRFRRDVEEGEWLYQSVSELNQLVQKAARDNLVVFEPWIRSLGGQRSLPDRGTWRLVVAGLERADAVAGKLDDVMSLQGIRFEELELLQGYCREMPLHRNSIEALAETGRKAVDALRASPPEGTTEQLQSEAAATTCEAAFAENLLERARRLHAIVVDLAAFVPLWLGNIGKRRALLLHPGGAAGASQGASDRAR